MTGRGLGGSVGVVSSRVLPELLEFLRELLELFAGRTGLRVRIGVGLWQRSRVLRVWIGLAGPAVRPALACRCWASAEIRIGGAGRWGWRGQRCRNGLIRHWGIRTCRGPVGEQGYPVPCWAGSDLCSRTRLGSRCAAHWIQTRAIRNGR